MDFRLLWSNSLPLYRSISDLIVTSCCGQYVHWYELHCFCVFSDTRTPSNPIMIIITLLYPSLFVCIHSEMKLARHNKLAVNEWKERYLETERSLGEEIIESLMTTLLSLWLGKVGRMILKILFFPRKYSLQLSLRVAVSWRRNDRRMWTRHDWNKGELNQLIIELWMIHNSASQILSTSILSIFSCIGWFNRAADIGARRCIQGTCIYCTYTHVHMYMYYD